LGLKKVFFGEKNGQKMPKSGQNITFSPKTSQH